MLHESKHDVKVRVESCHLSCIPSYIFQSAIDCHISAPANAVSSGIGNRRKKRSFLLRKCDVIKITQCWTIGNNGHHNGNVNNGNNNWKNGNSGNVNGHNGYSGNNGNNKWNNNGSDGVNNNRNLNRRNVNDRNVIKGNNRNNESDRDSGNVNNKNNGNDYIENGNYNIGNGRINKDTMLNKWKQFVGYGKSQTGESGDRNQQSDCRECNVRKKRHMFRKQAKRYNSRDDYEVTYDPSELPFGSFCGNNTAPGNLQHNNNDNGNGNKKTLTMVMHTVATAMDLVELKGVRS